MPTRIHPGPDAAACTCFAVCSTLAECVCGVPLLLSYTGEAMGPPGPGADGRMPNHTLVTNYYGGWVAAAAAAASFRRISPPRHLPHSRSHERR